MTPLAELLGESPAIQAVRDTVGRLLAHGAEGRRLPALLILGETGTGKGLLTRALHRAGPRALGPLVEVNCAAIPETLLEAELFGFERGAFTDARQPKAGLFQTAHGGTLFLDEVGLLPERVQAKFLKVLEDQAVRRLGATQSEPADVALVAATSADLRDAVRARRFREDLYHRLAVVTVQLPSLAERASDILLLAEHFLDRACADYGLGLKTLTPDAHAALLAYAWPGNIRELANLMERVALLTERSRVTVDALGLPAAPGPARTTLGEAARASPLRDAMGTVEREHLLAALLDLHGGATRELHERPAPHDLSAKEAAMHERLISGDNHIDLTYCPPDLWSSQAPAKWRLHAPRVEEREDGCHWLVEGRDQGMWNGVGPRFLKYEPGVFGHIDEMKAVGFTWDYRPGAQPRPTTPALRLADLDRDGVDAEIVYGCLMINELIEDADLRAWSNQIYNDWAADFAKRSDPSRIFPLAIIPNTDPALAAAEVRRCATLGLRGGDLAFKRLSVPLYHRGWDPLWEAAQECRFPISFHSSGFKGLRAPDTPQMEKEYAVTWRLVRASLFQLDGMEVLVSLIASGACERYPEFNFVLGESGVTWIPYVFDRLDTEYEDRGRSLGFSLKPSDYFRRQGFTTYQQDQHLEPAIPIVGEDNIIWGADYPHPDCLWPDSRRHLEKNLGGLPERVRRKITSENVAKLYQLPSATRTTP